MALICSAVVKPSFTFSAIKNRPLPSVLDIPNIDEQQVCDEIWIKLKNGIKDIDYSPIDWSVCDDELGRRFAYVRYYLIVLKDGCIPPQYLTLDC